MSFLAKVMLAWMSLCTVLANLKGFVTVNLPRKSCKLLGFLLLEYMCANVAIHHDRSPASVLQTTDKLTVYLCRENDKSVLELHYLKLPPPDLIAQAADFHSRDVYCMESSMLDPFKMSEFEAMANSLWPMLDSRFEQLYEV